MEWNGDLAIGMNYGVASLHIGGLAMLISHQQSLSPRKSWGQTLVEFTI